MKFFTNSSSTQTKSWTWDFDKFFVRAQKYSIAPRLEACLKVGWNKKGFYVALKTVNCDYSVSAWKK